MDTDTKNRSAAFDLFDAGTRLRFAIDKIEMLEQSDPLRFTVRIDLSFPPNAETRESDLERSAHGFLFVIGVLSFADATAEGLMSGTCDDDDNCFWIDDLLHALRWQGSTLQFSANCVRGRKMNTTVVLRSDGTGTLSTVGREMAAQRWLHCLQGDEALQLVSKVCPGGAVAE